MPQTSSSSCCRLNTRPGMLGQELDQLELLERQLEVALADPGDVRRLVDRQAPAAHDRLPGRGGDREGDLSAGEPDPGIDLGRSGRGQDDVVDAPVGGDRGQAALGDDEDDRHLDPGVLDQPAQPAHRREVVAPVDEQDVALGSLEQHGHLGRQDPHPVRQQLEGRQHVG